MVCLAQTPDFANEQCFEGITAPEYDASSVVTTPTDTTWYWHVTGFDADEKSTGQTDTQQFTIDTINPTAAVQTSTELAGGTTPTVSISGSVSDAHLTGYQVLVNGSVVQQVDGITATAAAVAYEWNVMVPTVFASGSYTVQIVAVDSYGNTANASTVVVVDTTRPEAAVAGGNTIINGGTIRPVVTASDQHEPLTYAWVGDASNPDASTFSSTQKEPVFTPTVEGDYYYYLVVRDSVGNESQSQLFSFGYRMKLEGIALPIIPTDGPQNPVAETPSLPAVIAASATPGGATSATTDARDTAALSNTIATSGNVSSTASGSVISPTRSGWSILGVLWYWWIAMIAVAVVVWRVAKKIVPLGASNGSEQA